MKDSSLTPGIVDLTDPPPILSGMVQISLDPQGRLHHLEVIPPEKETESAPFTAFNWNSLFQSAGLNQAQFQPATSMWNSLAASDAHAAWTGTWPGTAYPLRVEAASYRGKPVYFALIGNWTEPARMESSDETLVKKIWNAVVAVLALLLLLAAILIAWRNYVREKADVQGAGGWASSSFQSRCCFGFSKRILSPRSRRWDSSCWPRARHCSLQPLFARFIWPSNPSSGGAGRTPSSRGAGLWRAISAIPLVGRDILYGVLLGMSWALIYSIFYLLRLRAGDAPALGTTDYLLGARHVLGSWLWQLANSVQGTLLFFFLMFVLRVILRKPWLAALAFVAVWTAIKTVGSHHVLIDVSTFAAIYAIAAFVVLRFGFIALATGMFTVDLLLNIPITTNLSSWYMGGSLFVLLTVNCVGGLGMLHRPRRTENLEGESVRIAKQPHQVSKNPRFLLTG